MTTSYQYPPLPSEDYIRIATLEAGNVEDDLVIRLEAKRFSNHDPPHYEALSYVWGSETNKQSIYVCSKKSDDLGLLFVTQNLDVALRELRFLNRPRIIWIDGVCINQDDKNDKELQVKRMGEIFQLAARVIVWLGPEQDDSSNAMGRMNFVGSQVAIDERRKLVPAATCLDSQIIGYNEGFEKLGDRAMQSVCNLLCRPWFDRLWVRQEILSANPQAVVKCGSFEILWSRFNLALRCLWRWQNALPGRVGSAIKTIKARKRQLIGITFYRRPIYIKDLREFCANAKCKDPRDYIYGILSLLEEDEKRRCPQPDYTKELPVLYEEMAKVAISKSNSLWILGDCELSRGNHSPSWMPTWWKGTSRRLRMVSFASSYFYPSYDFYGKKGVLRVVGVVAMEVEYSDPIPDLMACNSYPYIYEELRKLISKQPSDTKYVTGISLTEAYARTIYTDNFDDNYIPFSSTRRAELKGGLLMVEQMLANMDFGTRGFELNSHGRQFLRSALDSLNQKRLIRSRSGYIGVAPPGTRPDDKICVLLGCDRLIALRPTEKADEYRVVGECFVEGLSAGEALLGPLPPNVRLVKVFEEATSQYRNCFRDHKTGEIFDVDPRLEKFAIDPRYPTALEEFHARMERQGSAGLQFWQHSTALFQMGVRAKIFNLV